VFNQNLAGLALGILAALIGAGGIAAALRSRGRRAANPEAYASAGGIVYTAVQIGCSGLLIVGGLVLVILVLLARR
jgi:hypothetical protein